MRQIGDAHCVSRKALRRPPNVHHIQLRLDGIGKMDQALMEQYQSAAIVFRVNQQSVIHGDRAEMHLLAAGKVRAAPMTQLIR